MLEAVGSLNKDETMDAEKARELADAASVLSIRAVQVTGPEAIKQWLTGLDGLLASFSPSDAAIAKQLDVASLGVLRDDCRWLIDHRQQFSSGEFSDVRERLGRVAAMLGRLAQAESAKRLLDGMPPLEQAGEWEVSTDRLGKGGQATVVYAWSERRKVRGAFKRPHVISEKAKERFLREVQAIERMRHPFILPVLDSGTDESGAPYLVTEIAPLGSLWDNRDAYRGDVWRSLRLCRHVATALASAHDHRDEQKVAAPIIHRDVKPGNVLLWSLDHPRLADFGIAHFESMETLTSTNEKVGDTFFAPPEYEHPDVEPTPSFDVYSLGAVLHFALSGTRLKRPYRGMKEIPRFATELNNERLKPIDDLIADMLARESEDRPQTMVEVIGRIDEIALRLFGGRTDQEQCVVCGNGRYRDRGMLDLRGGGQLIVASGERGQDQRHWDQEFHPHLLVCSTCGDMRFLATTGRA